MNVFLWPVHGSWTAAFVSGRHRYLVPAPPGGATGRWPSTVVELTPEQAATTPVDVVVLQRATELASLAEEWLHRQPGRDVPAVYLEHSTPPSPTGDARHPAACRPDLTLVHVTHFNRLFWDTGSTPVRVIEHGVVDPGHRYSGELPRAAAAINEPRRRGRAVGADLLPELGRDVPIDLFGIGTDLDLPQPDLHAEMARRRAYVHPYRWTSLGLSLIEAMHLGLPVVALATTEVPEAVPPDAGYVSNRLDVLGDGLRRLARDPVRAREMGEAGRRHALARFGLGRFLEDWDAVLKDAAR